MPHIILEHAAPLTDLVDIPVILDTLHQTLAEQETFSIDAIKSRALPVEHFIITTHGHERLFAHIQLRILEGRPSSIVQTSVHSLAQILIDTLPEETEITVEVLEMKKDYYFKR